MQRPWAGRMNTRWRERYANCAHEGVQVDQVGRPRQSFREESAHFVDRALERETEARSAWRDGLR